MFVRLRVSSTNLDWVRDGVDWYTSYQVPVVLTFMAYYTAEPQVPADVLGCRGRPVLPVEGPPHQLLLLSDAGFRPLRPGPVPRQPPRLLLRQPGRLGYCRLCRNCETYFIQTVKRMKGE